MTDKPKTLQEVLREMSTEDLERLSRECREVTPETHDLQACMDALKGLDVDLELHRRRRGRVP